MSSGNKTLMLNGENLQDSLDSQLYQRSQGDRLIAEVVSSYPRNALVVNSGKTEFALSRYREVYLDVPYQIHWSKLWLEAFDEAVSIVAVNNKSCNGILVKYDNKINLSPTPGLFTKVTDTPCGKAADLKISLKNNKNYFAHVNSYYFADLQTVQVINNEFLPDIGRPNIGRPNIGLQVSLVDAGGNIVDSRCAKIDSSLFVDWYRPEMEVESTSVGRPAINGQASVYGVLRLHNVKNIDQVIKINLNVEKTCT
jgi:hypothetical protein